MRAAAGVAITAFTVLAGCTSAEHGTGALEGTRSAATTPRGAHSDHITQGGQPAADFTNCNDRVNRRALPAGRRKLDFFCARIDVPLDYAKPSGRTIALQLIKAHDAANTSGRTLLLNRGGPGVGGVNFAIDQAAGVPTALLQHYDLVGFDPRGVGLSTPVECYTDAQKDAANAASPDMRTNAGFVQAKAAAARFAHACAAKYGSALADFDTMQTVHDMDRIRQALRAPTLNYLGFSYGTRLGAEYAHVYPTKVGAMVLDGAEDPLTGDIAAATNQLAGFEKSFDQFAAWCGAHSPCTKLADPRETVYNLVATARRAPIPSAQPGEKRRATVSLVLTGVLLALYSQSEWPVLAQALLAAEQGNSAGLLQLADEYNERTNGHYTNVDDAGTTIGCNDARPGPTDATIRATTKSWVKRFPMFGLWTAPDLFSCQQWQPHRTVPPLPTARTSAHTVLVLGNVHDPATPYAGAKHLTAALGRARLLSWNGAGHTSFQQGSSCIDAAVVAFLDAGHLPPNGKTCPR